MRKNRSDKHYNLYYIFLEDLNHHKLTQRQIRRIKAAIENSSKNFQNRKTKRGTKRSYKYNNKKEV